VIAAAVVLIALAGCGDSGGHHGTAANTAASLPPPDHVRHGREWWAPNANLANTRQVASRIAARDVARLHVAWRVPLSGTYAATPIVTHGVAYTADLLSNVYAIDLRTGGLKWRKQFADSAVTGPNGVNVAGGRVFGVLPRAAFALDASSGRLLWRTRLVRRSEVIVMTPGYKDGVVYVSTNPLAGGDIGTLWALDARTGRRLWSWRQSSWLLWGDPAINGSGGLWHPPGFDDEGGVYVSIADPSPWPGTPEQPWARSRPGPNRWSNSLVKLDRTGRFVWGRQLLPHDFYDWDLQCPPILVTVGGRRVVLTAGKMGFVFALDADSGRLLWKRSVGRHNGHDEDSVRAMDGDYSNVGYGRRIYPGDQGGVETQMASDGETVYVPVNNLYAVYRSQTLPESQDLMQGTGEVVALDLATGRVRWDRKLPHGMYGGATLTNDLVFTTTYDGTLWALARRTGRVVWKAPLPAGSIAPVAISGDTVLSAGGIRTAKRQRLAITAFRLG
jgi:outer membrane protein assembly factor BamB